MKKTKILFKALVSLMLVGLVIPTFFTTEVSAFQLETGPDVSSDSSITSQCLYLIHKPHYETKSSKIVPCNACKVVSINAHYSQTDTALVIGFTYIRAKEVVNVTARECKLTNQQNAVCTETTLIGANPTCDPIYKVLVEETGSSED